MSVTPEQKLLGDRFKCSRETNWTPQETCAVTVTDKQWTVGVEDVVHVTILYKVR